MSTNDKTIRWYQENASSYAQHVRSPESSIYHAYYEKPAMSALLPDLKDASVVSLGCGSGEDSRYLKHQGAARSVGIDISDKLIDIARSSYPDCEFEVMDMEKLELGGNEFDLAYASFSLHYLKNLRPVFDQVFRILKPGGILLFSHGHPVWSAMELVANDENVRKRELSQEKQKQTGETRLVGDYLKLKPIEGSAMDVTTWHRPIGLILSDLLSSGFQLLSLVEPIPDEKMKVIKPQTFNKLQAVPEVLIVKAVKPGG